MTVKEWIRNKILKFLGIERLPNNPNDERLQFITDDDAIKLDNVKANRIWYIGDGDELLNFYTQRQATGFMDNPIYNRNKRNYFWSLSAEECDIKRVHSGVPNAIITTITNIIGMPNIKIEGYDDVWDGVVKENDFVNKITQQARPLTLVEGWGAWKPNFNKKLSRYPLWEYYDAEYVEFIYKCGVLFGIMYKSFYKDKNNKDYMLIETRYRVGGDSRIDYNLFKVNKNNDIEEVPINTLPELSTLDNVIVRGLDRILGVPAKYFYDPQNPKYGRSIFTGKLDLFDMLDEVWSQASQTARVSTPIEYYNPDILGRDSKGGIRMPHVYNRQFMQKTSIADGEGKMNEDVITTQPKLEFDKYGMLAKDILDYILTGVLSPATMGIEVARKDNATAQREKEKISIMTRNNIISSETPMLKNIVELSLLLYDYMQTDVIDMNKKYDIGITYTEFANPSFENQIQVLGKAWANGELSTRRYIDLLWQDKLSDEEKEEEANEIEMKHNSLPSTAGTGMDGNVGTQGLPMPDLEPSEDEIGDADESIVGKEYR